MKKLLLVFLTAFICVAMYSQDTTQYPRVYIRLYFENGADFLRNDMLKENYETGSKYFWGFGMQFGYPGIHNAIPYFQYTTSKYKITSDDGYGDTSVDSTLSTNQFNAGLLIPLVKIEKTYLRARLGLNVTYIRESFYRVSDYSTGFQAGLGIDTRFMGFSRAYIDILYNYNKVGNGDIRDFDFVKLCFGVIL